MAMTIKPQLVGLDEEVQDFIKQAEEDIPITLQAIGSALIDTLNIYIEDRYYNLYTPSVYVRRYFNGGLLDEAYKDATVKGKTLKFTYLPKGEPQYTNLFTGKPFFKNVNNNDDLIVWGQKEHFFKDRKIPARPYWNEFVNKLYRDGEIMQLFEYYTKLPIILEGGERDLEFTASESILEQD